MELKEIMKNAGIVGAGGAGFPSYAKLAGGVDTLLVNGAECEPLLYTDYIILQREPDTVLKGITAVMQYLSISKAILSVKEHTAKRLGYTDGQSFGKGVTVKFLPDVYPMGDEISLIYESTGRLVKPGNLPVSAGVIVYNVETLYNVGMALEGKPLTMKWLTVGGDIEKSTVIKVPIGTKVSDLFESLGITVPNTHSVLDGGPSMGKLIDPYTATVKKTTKGLLVIPNNTEAIISKNTNSKMAVARAETACCQCTRCTDMCPRHLLGYPLEPHKMVRTAMQAAVTLPQMVISATLCCGCGICESIACCQGISPKAVINNYKALLSQNKMRFSSNESFEVSREREYRKLPVERWAKALGILEFDKVPEYIGERVNFKRFEIPLSQSIGAPSIPTVSIGDAVDEAEIIAKAAEGLSLPIHSPIKGKIAHCDEKKIIITR